jgi:catechol 2,3-dioxygenase-like lactoylglutathione lyase family enzyme
MFTKVRAFSGFSVDDIDTARAFYGGILGLDVTEEHGMLHVAIKGGNPLLIYPKADHVPATYTALNFPVEDLAATLDALAARGVETIKYPGTDERGIMGDIGGTGDMGPAIAWFADPAGNIISVLEASG